MSPVAVPELSLSENAKASLAKHRAALINANNNLRQSRNWYLNLAK
jgi:predicted kinase